MLNQDTKFEMINSSDKIIPIKWNIALKISSLKMFLPTYSVAVLEISIKEVHYDQLIELKDLTED
jgi:hypothetical protein